MPLDDTARGFHAEVLGDIRALMHDAEMPDAVMRVASSLLATVITDLNRVARAAERIADAQEDMARAYSASVATAQ